MGKRETKDTYKDVKSDQAQAETQYAGAQGEASNQAKEAKSNVDSEKNQLSEGYSSLPGKNNNVDSSRFDPIYSGYMDLAGNGGYDNARRSSIMENVSGLKDIGKTGGLDAESMNRFRGSGVYDEFAKSGGYSDKDQANIKAQALSPISSYAKSTNDELDRRRSVQGGYGPGFDASSRALRRDTSRGIADTSLNANVMLKDKVNAGRQWGATGQTSSENSLQGLRTGNMLAGLQGAGNQEMAMQNSINSTRLGGYAGASGAANQIAGIQGGNIDRSNAANAYALQGQQGLYNTDVNQYNGALDRGTNLLNSGVNANQSYYSPRNQLATQPGFGGNLIKGVGAAAGVGSALMGGGASYGGAAMPQYIPNGRGGNVY